MEMQKQFEAGWRSLEGVQMQVRWTASQMYQISEIQVQCIGKQAAFFPPTHAQNSLTQALKVAFKEIYCKM